MDLFKFGMEQMNNGTLNNMLEQVGVDDVGSFVNQFRNQAGSSERSGGAGNSGDMIQGAMNAYKMFSGGQGGSGGGSFMDNVGKRNEILRGLRVKNVYPQVRHIKMHKKCTPCTSNLTRMVMEK